MCTTLERPGIQKNADYLLSAWEIQIVLSGIEWKSFFMALFRVMWKSAGSYADYMWNNVNCQIIWHVIWLRMLLIGLMLWKSSLPENVAEMRLIYKLSVPNMITNRLLCNTEYPLPLSFTSYHFEFNHYLFFTFYPAFSTFGIHRTQYNKQPGCVILHLVLHYFMLSNYAWMLCEGFYLHTVLVSAFISEQRLVRWLMAFGWIAPAILLTTYGVTRGVYGTEAHNIQ